MLDSARARAEETILDQRLITLDDDSYKSFLAMLDAPRYAQLLFALDKEQGVLMHYWQQFTLRDKQLEGMRSVLLSSPQSARELGLPNVEPVDAFLTLLRSDDPDAACETALHAMQDMLEPQDADLVVRALRTVAPENDSAGIVSSAAGFLLEKPDRHRLDARPRPQPGHSNTACSGKCSNTCAPSTASTRLPVCAPGLAGPRSALW